MIKIKIPKYDGVVKKEEYNSIPKGSGVYIFHDKKGVPLYVGQCVNLNTRIYSHFYGYTQTGGFEHLFHKCSFFLVDSQTDRKIYELFLIDELKPLINLRDKQEFMQKRTSISRKMPESLKCCFVKRSGERCKNGAHSNGFCNYHGGNGITRQIYIENAIKKFEEELFGSL